MADQETILNALRTVKDPELNVNVVDLGLVYSIQTQEDQIDVEMTLTTPGVPGRPGDLFTRETRVAPWRRSRGCARPTSSW